MNNSSYRDEGPVYKMPRCFHVIGDLHGDYELLLSQLIHVTKVMSSKMKWIAPNNTYLVVCGDMLDRMRMHETLDDKGRTFGEIPLEENKILDLLNDLHIQAQANNGKVIKVLGNHEIMNILGDFAYVTPYAMMTYQQLGGRKKYFGVDGEGTKKILMGETYPIIKIGNNIIVHGGVSTALSKWWNSTKRHSLFKFAQEYCNELYDTGMVSDISDKLLIKPDSLCWDRSHSQNNVNYKEFNRIMANINETGCNLIVAHCPQSQHFKFYHNAYVMNRLVSYDKKHRAVFGGPLTCVYELDVNFVGINATNKGRCWHIDISASRCFPCIEHSPEYLFSIRPAALRVTKTSKKKQQFNVLVASRGLDRGGPCDGGIPIGCIGNAVAD